jgi:hypothetical protein
MIKGGKEALGIWKAWDRKGDKRNSVLKGGHNMPKV